MKLWFTLALLLLTALQIVVALRAYRKKERLWTLLAQMMTSIVSMDFFYLLSIYLSFPAGVLFFQGAYHVCYLFLLYSFLRFVYYYAEAREIPAVLHRIILALAVLDLLAMTIGNALTRFAFTYTDETGADGYLYHRFNLGTTYYSIHMYFTYAIAVITLGLIILRFFNTDSVYRRRYSVLLGIFAIMVGMYVVFYPFHSPLDLILLSFNLLTLVLYYAIGRFIPRDLMMRIMGYAASSLEEGVVCFDNLGKLLYVNAKAYDPLRLSGVEDDIETHYLKLMSQNVKPETESSGWTERITDDGADYYFDFHFQRLREESGAFIGSYFTIQDRTAENRMLETERVRATHDQLTGLLNTEGFVERAARILAEAPDVPRYLLTSNIRDFKLVNDLFGPEKGNEVLCGIADRIRHVRSENTICARMTGDHFVMLMDKDRFNESDFMEGIEEVGKLIHATSYKLCLHVGVFEIDDPSMSVPLMIDRARMAIATIKDENKSMIVHYSNRMLQDSLNERRVVGELQQAITNEDITVYFQPQVDGEGNVIGAEALARWVHPTDGLLLPAAFIPILEHAGLIYQLDLAVWESACKQLNAWRGTVFDPLYISVNISARDFYYIDLYSSLTRLADLYHIDPKKLHLEITESAMIGSFEEQRVLIGKLRAYGFEVEIDDFGSGYSSLSMLKDLPVDTLKLDLMFLKETENRMRARVILASVVSLTSLLGMQVIAEGVESEQQLSYLKTLGCSRFQGYYFSRPVPVADFEEYFRASLS